MANWLVSKPGVTIVMRYKGILAACGALALLAFSGSPMLGESSTAVADSGKPRVKATKMARSKAKRGTRVRGFLLRGGYYSYIDADVINVYGGSRAKYGSTNVYRDFLSDRQTPGGPFDSGFFFDSGIGPRWNDSPYPR
jgi:hypothetical protein